MRRPVLAPARIPEDAVKIGHSLWAFPDPELARRALEEDAPQLYSGRCVYYGHRLSDGPRREDIGQWLRRKLGRYRLRHPFRLVAFVLGWTFVVYGAISRQASLLLAGMVFLGAGIAHYRMTRRGE